MDPFAWFDHVRIAADRGEQQMGPCQGRRHDVVIGGRRRKPGTRRRVWETEAQAFKKKKTREQIKFARSLLLATWKQRELTSSKVSTPNLIASQAQRH